MASLDAGFTQLLCQSDASHDFAPSARAIVLVRPENMVVSFQPLASGVNVWRGQVVSSNFLGDYIDCKIACGDTVISARVNPFVAVEVGATVYLHVPPERCSIIRDTA